MNQLVQNLFDDKNEDGTMKQFLILLMTLFLYACSAAQTDRAYQELGRSENFKLNDSLIIGFEKINSAKANIPPGDLIDYPFISIPADISANQVLTAKRAITGQAKIILPTQIVFQDSEGDLDFHYNLYKIRSEQNTYSMDDSLNKMRGAFDRLAKVLNEGNYTHLMIYSMGWNNDQVESVYRFNRLKASIKSASKHGSNYKPFIVGITWPSVWSSISSDAERLLGHLSSYPTKSNDSDEIGYTWANLMLNELVPNTLNTLPKSKRPKVVLLGHSMGARLLSRALFSKAFLTSANKTDTWSPDLFLGLQGAFSARRFGKDGKDEWGREGSPYQGFKSLNTQIVLTTSKHDNANPIAFWSCHVGSTKWLVSGLDCAKDNQHFQVEVWPKAGDSSTIKFDLQDKRVIMIDASNIIGPDEDGEDDEGYKTDGHNDVLDKEIGKLIWYFMQQI